MTVGAETLIIEGWLDSRLQLDLVLAELVGDRIYGHLAPPEAAHPLVVFTAQGPRDIRGVGTARIMIDALYQVKGIDRGRSFAPLEPIARRLDELLHGASGATDAGWVLGCVREEPISYSEVDDGTEYRHLGGLYRFWAHG